MHESELHGVQVSSNQGSPVAQGTVRLFVVCWGCGGVGLGVVGWLCASGVGVVVGWPLCQWKEECASMLCHGDSVCSVRVVGCEWLLCAFTWLMWKWLDGGVAGISQAHATRSSGPGIPAAAVLSESPVQRSKWRHSHGCLMGERGCGRSDCEVMHGEGRESICSGVVLLVETGRVTVLWGLE